MDFLIDVRPWREQKEAALRAHRSQHPGIDLLFLNPPDREQRLSLEAFRQGWGPAPQTRPAADLFAGLE